MSLIPALVQKLYKNFRWGGPKGPPGGIGLSCMQCIFSKLIPFSFVFQVQEVREYLLSRAHISEENLHQASREIEPAIHAKFSTVHPAGSAPIHPSAERRASSQSNIFRHGTTGRVTGRRSLGIMKPSQPSTPM